MALARCLTRARIGLLLLVLVGISACSSTVAPLRGREEPVDLPRFMGDWYVIGFIPIHLPPLFSEQDAHNAIESYRLEPDGTIATTYVFRRGGFDGPRIVFRPRARVINAPVNSEWKMKFFWFLPAGDFLILHVDADYRETIIGVPDRRYAWIMSRSPALADLDYDRLVGLLRDRGYDTSLVRRVPQRWP